jgi:adenosylmethionine-8-amino-7-oxononanoate aminotransferase
MNSPVWRPFTQHGLDEPIPLIVRSEGAALWTDDGCRIIDAISSWWVTTHGHRHPRIMAAIAAESERLDQIIFAGWTHEPAERLGSALVDLLPEPLAHIFYSDSGSTSVEVGLKMALGYWRNRGSARHRIAVMESGYHGDTVGGMSVGARGPFNRAYERLLFEVETLPFPQEGEEQRTIDRLESLCRAPEPPAALIVEPLVLGAGGMRLYPPSVLAELHNICRRHGVLLIADEVMTGWGRTGTLFACEQAAIAPDIMCLSKGLTGGAMPLAVTAATPEIFEAHRSADRAQMLFHSSSYTANPIACAAALANIDIWREEPVLERIATLSSQQSERLGTLASHPAIHNRRQIGTITAMELGSADGAYLSTLGPRLLAFFRERGLLLRPLGNTVYVMPPYCIDPDDLDSIYRAIGDAADELV